METLCRDLLSPRTNEHLIIKTQELLFFLPLCYNAARSFSVSKQWATQSSIAIISGAVNGNDEIQITYC
jgi:hypothetical protein